MSDDSIDRAIGQVQGTLEEIKGMLVRHFEDDKENFGDLVRRLTRVEKRGMWTSGLVAGAIAFVTAKLTGH